jgi:hypothetical protein
MYWDKFEDRVDQGENRWEKGYKEGGKKLLPSFLTVDITTSR